MKLETILLNQDQTGGLVKIKEKGKAQQTPLNVDYLIRFLEMCKSFKRFGIETIWITVEDNHPIVVGGKKIGFALAPYEEGD